jgi:4-hydroxy-3-methylbut-2-enyl diphosphate reductase
MNATFPDQAERPPAAAEAKAPLRLIAAPRGFCAGVTARSRSWSARSALWRAGLCPARDRPQPLRGGRAEGKGAIFVEELDEVPDGAPVVFSAHGVPK